MAHLIFATRGIYASVQQLIHDLTAQRFWWRRVNMKEGDEHFGETMDVPVQGALRPIQLWEYVYPKESPEEPGNLKSPMIDNTKLMLRSFDISGPNHYEPKALGWGVNLMRKKLGLKEIPKVEDMSGPQRFIHLAGTSIVPIGIKDDEYKIHDFGPAGKWEQEML